MEIETTITKIGDSYFVRIPAALARFFKITDGKQTKAKIKDISKSEARVLFKHWQ